ncbi:MAG TPA: YchJ family metal-binding protein [Ramlibacter sp.]|nr:YchJ family metal-binding protein [Ramlibacter sp.]
MNATPSIPDASGLCTCGRRDARGAALPFGRCCGPLLGKRASAADAQALMRSRYTAFVLGDVDYLLATWHASTRPGDLTLDVGVRWLGLEVRAARDTGADRAEVEFVARSRPAGPGPAHRLHERSRFVREDGRWFYVDGDLL